MKRKISILLVQPENPDNIGAVARAMKNMKLGSLRIVHPPDGWKVSARKMAVAAADLLETAELFESVKEAIKNSTLVIGTTRRPRRFQANHIDFAEALHKIDTVLKRRQPVTIMFGKESKGLDNESLDYCDWVTTIPANPVYPSINLAQAVMIVAFSLMKPSSSQGAVGIGGERVNKEEEYEVLQAFKSALEELQFSEKSQLVSRILSTFHGLIKRTGLMKREAQMLKGVSRRIRERVTEKIND